MTTTFAKSESVYQCDVCTRKIRVPSNRKGLEIVHNCIITADCKGSLHRVMIAKEINDTPAFTPELPGVQDWVERNVLFTFTQPVQSNKWIVTHNLGNIPNVFAYVERQENNSTVLKEIEPKSITPIDGNIIEVLFDQAEKGLAQCIASASQNYINPTTSTTSTINNVQLTNNGELTIATLAQDASVNLKLTYNSPTSTSPVLIEYLNLTDTTIESAWNGISTIIINGKKYIVRSFNIVTTPMAPSYFQSGTIGDGSTVYFMDIQAIGNVLILLSNSPHAAVDRVNSKYIDVAAIGGTQSQIYYNNGNLFAASTIVKDTYPPIIIIDQ